MPAYTTLSDADLTAGKPGTQAKFRALRDNPLAMAERDPSAPLIVGATRDILAVKTANNSADLQFLTSDWSNSGYDEFEFRGIDLRPATAAVYLANVSADNGSTWKTSYQCGGTIQDATNGPFTVQPWGSASLTDINLTSDLQGVEASQSGPLSFVLRVSDPAASSYPRGEWKGHFRNQTNGLVRVVGAFHWATNQAWNAIRFRFSGVNTQSGRIALYGIYHS